MNIFYLHKDPVTCAQYHCDKHTVKMILEYAQLLSTAHHFYKTRLASSGKIYKSTHVNHPSAIWARECRANYGWLHELLVALCKEYTYRYHKIHKVQASGLLKLLSNIPEELPLNLKTTMPQAMPDHCKHKNSITAYHNYYAQEKERMLTFTGRRIPDFLKTYGYSEQII